MFVLLSIPALVDRSDNKHRARAVSDRFLAYIASRSLTSCCAIGSCKRSTIDLVRFETGSSDVQQWKGPLGHWAEAKRLWNKRLRFCMCPGWFNQCNSLYSVSVWLFELNGMLILNERDYNDVWLFELKGMLILNERDYNDPLLEVLPQTLGLS